MKIRSEPFVFCQKNFAEIYFIPLFLVFAAVMGGGWVVGTGPGRGCKKIKISYEDASVKRYEHFLIFKKF